MKNLLAGAPKQNLNDLSNASETFVNSFDNFLKTGQRRNKIDDDATAFQPEQVQFFVKLLSCFLRVLKDFVRS